MKRNGKRISLFLSNYSLFYSFYSVQDVKKKRKLFIRSLKAERCDDNEQWISLSLSLSLAEKRNSFLLLTVHFLNSDKKDS